MPKSRKKEPNNSSIVHPPTNNQSLLSKYFTSSIAKQPILRKRLSSATTSGNTSQKVLKLECTSEEATDLKPKGSLSKENDFNIDFEPVNVTVPEISSVDKHKSKLSCFTFNRQSKSSLKHEFSECKQIINKSSSLGSMDTMGKSSDSPEIEHRSAISLNKIKYTHLEKQYLEFQEKYPDAVLLIECGYKYRMFGKDAKIASKDLNIGCFQYHNFFSASIPVHRLHYHVRRLVLKGHKVGVIKQTESSALKAASETRNELFSRELYAMYTKSTFIEEGLSVLNDENSVEVQEIDDNDAVSGYLICINEASLKNQPESVNIACVALQVSSGDIFYSSFQDNLIQNELEGIFMGINPAEILLPLSQLSKKTENLVKSFSCDSMCSSRVERLDDKVFEHTFALNNMSNFICNVKSSSSLACGTQDNLQMLLSLPPLVISCLSALMVYLSDFKVENILHNIYNIKPFSTVGHMNLNADTIRSLELLKNNCSPQNYGTLFWCMNRTLTKFGERLLKSWILKPLKDIQRLEERLNIVTEIIHSDSVIFQNVSRMLYKLPDLEKLLCLVFYHKCSCNDFLKLVTAFANIRNGLVGLVDKINSDINVSKLKTILLTVLENLDGIQLFISNIDSQAAKDGNKVKLFKDTTKYANMEECKSRILGIEKKLSDLRPAICKILRLPAFKYATVAGQKFLIEVPNGHLSLVPDEWLKISVTKQVSRFQSPEVIGLCKGLYQEEERLMNFADEAWKEFLTEFGNQFYKYKKAVSNLAEMDVYLSLAQLSKDEKYCRPVVLNTEDRQFNIQQGWHPVVVKLMGEEKQFVSNDTNLNTAERCLIVTGPNMGGKSTYIRQIALIALMAHIGCYVPAESATVPLLDGIYVRMGADDDILNKKSTFMLEMTETSNILSSVTHQSLVILDELGRGTSTNDGTSIAYATLEYLIRDVKCLVLFVTHYPPVVELKNNYPENILTVHMAYLLKEIDDDNCIETVTFLYNVVSGISEKSYGINVAALAGISKDILFEAQRKSWEMELKMKVQRHLRNMLKCLESRKADLKS